MFLTKDWLLATAPEKKGHGKKEGFCVEIKIGFRGARFPGKDHFALQKAADELARLRPGGGGILKIGPGTYQMLDSLHLRAPMTVRGSGRKTILRKGREFKTLLTRDLDRSETEARVADSSFLQVGMGIAVKDRLHRSEWGPSLRTVAAIDGNLVRLDRRPDNDYSVSDRA